MTDHTIYLDYQATTPMAPQVVDAMLPYLRDKFANPASLHMPGAEAQHAVSRARRAVARALRVNEAEIVFTSGASEANNLAIKGIARAAGHKGHIVSIATEHKCVLGALSRLEKEGHAVTLIPVDTRGLLDLNRLEEALRGDTILVSAMFGNNETGSLHPISHVARLARARGIPLHVDATQAIGHLPVYPSEMGIDLMTFSGHKLYGPKGVGVLFVAQHLSRDRRIAAEIDGGGQEHGLRGGTLNVPSIVGLQRAVELVQELRQEEYVRADTLRRELLTEICGQVDCISNTPLDLALPHCLNLSFPGVNGQSLVQALGRLALSTGSACNSGSQRPSHVLSAMGVPADLIAASIRLSIGRPTSRADVQCAAGLIVEEVRACRMKARIR